MIKLTKKKGHIILELCIKEGSHENWEGLHKWDFFLKDNKLFLKGKNTVEINISDLLKKEIKLTETIINNIWMTLVFKKL